MDKNLNVRVIAFPIRTYDISFLEEQSDRELSEIALADADCEIYSSLKEFQNAINDDDNEKVDTINNWLIFLTDLV